MAFRLWAEGGPLIYAKCFFFQNSYTFVQGDDEPQVFFKGCFSTCNKEGSPPSSSATRGSGRLQSKIWPSFSFHGTVY